MAIDKNKIVSVTYELRVGNKLDGEIVEVSTNENPLTFPFGTGMLLPKFESALTEKEVGDSFEIEINAKDGYGEIDENMVVNIPKTAFEINGEIDYDMISVGNTIPMMSTSGHPMNGIILEIEDDDVIMDFNHPLAGQDLFFTGNVIEIRDMTEDEFSHSCDSEEGCGNCGCDHKH